MPEFSARVSLIAAAILLVAIAPGCATSGGGEAPRGAADVTADGSVSEMHASVVPSAPDGVSEEIGSAWQALRAGRPGVARRRLQQQEPADGEPARQAAIGFAAYLLGEAASADEAFDRALRGRQEYPPALYGKGLVAEEAGDVDSARTMYRRALEADSTLVQAEIALERLDLVVARSLVARAAGAEARGDEETAIEQYRRALELAPRLQRPYLELADLLLARDRAEEAATLLRQARARLDLDPRYLRPLGEALLRAGSYADALDVLERVREARPDDPHIDELVTRARERYEEASMPEEYRRLREADVIRREDLAALVATGLRELIGDEEAAEPEPIIVDIDDSWAARYISEAVRWGVMEVFQNHGFLPELPVTRGMMARVVGRVVERAGLDENLSRPRIRDVPEEHVLYESVQIVAALDLMETDAQGNFGDLLEQVSGEEAFQVLERLRRRLRERRR